MERSADGQIKRHRSVHSCDCVVKTGAFLGGDKVARGRVVNLELVDDGAEGRQAKRVKNAVSLKHYRRIENLVATDQSQN